MGMTMAVGSIVSSIAGAGVSAMAQQQSAQYNSQVARNNQIIANQNASIALQQGQQQEENKRIQTGEMLGAIESGEAASGVNPNEGSALNVRTSAAGTGELDAMSIRYNTDLQARNSAYAAQMYGSQAQLDTAQGEWGAMSSILGGASSVSNKWLQYQMNGVGSSGGGSNSNFSTAGMTNLSTNLGVNYSNFLQ
jgi:hypothetical protein